MKLKSKEELQRYRKYHTPNCGNLNSIKLNAIFLRKSNSKEHEQGKFDVVWDISSFITEAERSATEEECVVFDLKRKRKIVDVVNLCTGQEIEIVHKHETDQQIKFYRDNGVFPLIVGECYVCPVCKMVYPIRNQKGICANCLGRTQ